MPKSANLMRRLSQSSVARAVAMMAGAAGIGQLAILAALPLLTRLYDPAAFGLHALILAFVGVASVGACLCLDLAIVQARTASRADELCAAAIASAAVTALLSAITMSILVGTGLFGFGALPWWSSLMVAAMVGLNGAYIACRYRHLREQHYPVLARATLAQSAGRAFAPLVWFLVLPIWAGLSLGELSGRVLGVRGLLLPLLGTVRKQRAGTSPRVWWQVVRRERSYTLMLLATVLVDACASLLIAPLLAGAYGISVVGEYFLVATLLAAPSALVGAATADVLHTRSAQLLHEAPERLAAFLHRTALLLFVAACAIYLPVYFLSPLVFPALFGPKWKLIVPIAQAMTPFMIVAFVASPCSRLLLVVNRTGLKIISDAVRLVGTPCMIAVASSLHLSFLSAMWVLAWFLAAAYGLYLALTLLAVRWATSTISARSSAI
jgi:O-antigen/teichoic acid export membrane protein